MSKFVFNLPKRDQILFKGIKDFEIQNSIGKGGFSSVYLGKHKSTQVKYAIKKMDFRNLGNLD